MVRKISAILAMLVLIIAIGNSAQAVSFTAYDGTMSNTYVQYFKDIISGIGFNENYVAFRSGQYEYTMVTGDIEYNADSNSFSLSGDGTQYQFVSSSNYGNDYSYEVSTITDFTLNPSNEIVYSDVGVFPQLVERGAKYEMLTTLLIIILLLGCVVMRFFHSR